MRIPAFKYLPIIQLLLFASFLFAQWPSIKRSTLEQYALPQPIPASSLRLLTIGEAEIGAKMLSFWLLRYDNHAGQVIPFEQLDYRRLRGWLKTISELDPLSDYASIVAAGVFIEVRDRACQLIMIEFVREQFLEHPAIHWFWMAQVVMFAKYRLHDMPLALSLARDLRKHSTGTNIPYWAGEMEAYLLQDMGELEAALVLFKAMVEQGTIHDADELRFLEHRIEELQTSLRKKQPELSEPQHN